MKTFLPSSALLFTLAACFALAARSETGVKFETEWIVPPEAARELILSGALVVDVREKSLFRRTLENAVSLSWEALSEPDLPTKGKLLADDAVLTKKLQALGISANRPIVVVGDPANGWGEDGRVAWALRTLGHSKTVIADGGIEALRKSGALRVLPPKIPGDFVVARDPRWHISKEELRASLNNPTLVIFDVREPREYRGETPYGETRGGHVPGARGLWFKTLLDKDGRLLPAHEIEKRLAANGVTKESEIVSYCTGGIRSAWFTAVLADMGYKARNYAGSMWEWSASSPAQYPLTKD
jgi:thiosulfate/3-mercaptopyruvate sulfurtransferase